VGVVPEDLHLVKSVSIEDVECVVAVHEDLGEVHFVNDRVDDEWEPTGVGHVVRMIAPIEGDGHLRPPQTC
jgi:hypothetical protein